MENRPSPIETRENKLGSVGYLRLITWFNDYQTWTELCATDVSQEMPSCISDSFTALLAARSNSFPIVVHKKHIKLSFISLFIFIMIDLK